MRSSSVDRFLRVAATALLLALLLAAPAFACPVCSTDTGQQVRQGIFDDRFWVNVFLMLLPFPIFIGVAVALYRGFSSNPKPASPPRGGQ